MQRDDVPDSARPHEYDRRTFLARIGLLGTIAATPGLFTAASAGAAQPTLLDLTGSLQRALAELARDTLNGVAAFGFPGSCEYSKAQGTPRTEPGAAEAKTTDFMIVTLDDFVPFPDQLAKPIAAGVATGLSGAGVRLPVVERLPVRLGTLDRALRHLLENDETLPLSVSIALLINLAATQVNPLSVEGRFLSPFARLTYAEKAKAFELLERPSSNIVALLDTQFPQPTKQAVSGLLKFMSGSVLQLVSFGSMSEWAVWDAANKTTTSRPVGWELSDFLPDGPVRGWDDFKGYYQGRTEVHD